MNLIVHGGGHGDESGLFIGGDVGVFRRNGRSAQPFSVFGTVEIILEEQHVFP